MTYVKNKQGFSLIEILVTISIFAVIGTLSARAVSITLKSSKKSDSLVRVRENVNYSFAVIERQIRNSDEVDCSATTATSVAYTSLEGIASTFSCINTGTAGYISSGSARLTSTDIAITSCAFSCTQANANVPAIIRLSITASDSTYTGTEKGVVTSDMEIVTRNY